MGLIAKVLSFVRTTAGTAKVSDVKSNSGGDVISTAQHFSSAGDDSHPLADDYVLNIPVQRTGSKVAVGYLDPKNEPKAQAGEKRIYARKADTGEVIVELWLKNDGAATLSNSNGSTTLNSDGGSITTTPQSTFETKADGSIKGDNGSGSFELKTDGNFLVNGVTIDPSGNISTAGKINADDITADNQNVTLSTHGHPALNSPPTPGT